MFTGIIEEIGNIREIRRAGNASQLTVTASKVCSGLKTGDSINTNGVCLTVVRFTQGEFTVDVMPETMQRTNLGALRPGSPVNLERALTLSARLGGHLVSGHIDGTGRLEQTWTEDHAAWFRIGAPAGIMRYIVEKGSVAVDGISLTVVDADAGSFTVSVIPHTQQETTITGRKPGDRLNIECDVIAKYTEKLLGKQGRPRGIDEGFLAEHGFKE
jgi:riboflavin synthase